MNVGDRVYMSCSIARANIKFGDTGTILDERRGLYLVEFDRDIGGHDGSNRGERGHCCWLSPNKIRRIVKSKKEVKQYER